MAKGSIDENKAFFESFQEDHREILTSTTFDNTEDNKSVFIFQNSELKKSNIFIEIKCNQISDDLVIRYADKKLEYEITGKCISVILPKEYLEGDNTVFNLSFIQGLQEEIVTCWYNDFLELLNFL